MYLAGAAMEQIYAFGPSAGSAANITFFSYLDRAHLAFNLDPGAIPDPRRLVSCMKEGFDEVLKLG